MAQNADIEKILESLRNSSYAKAPTDNLQNEIIKLRDYQINTVRRAPSLQEKLAQISAGEPAPPSGAFGTIGKILVGNPITKSVLSGFNTLAYPRRIVQSSVLELKNAIDNNPNTVASLDEWRKNVVDPTFGGGDIWKGKGWGHRILGFGLDLALDPLTIATLGGSIAPRAALSKAAQELAGVSGTQATTRAFVGTKYIASADGRNALARAVGKLGGSVDEMGRIAAQGRRAVPDKFVEMLGLQDYGIYYFGSRLKVPFTGTIGEMLATGMSKGRLGILRSNSGNYLQNLMTTGGVRRGMSLRDLKIGLSKNALKDVDSRQALAILAGSEAERGVTNLTKREGGSFLKTNVVENNNIAANQDELYEFVDVPENQWTSIPSDEMRRAIDQHRNVVGPYFLNAVNSAGQDLGVNIEPRANWFPHKMTPYATRFLDTDRSQRVANILKYVNIDHTNLEGSFTSRQLENAVNNALKNGEKIDWFGTALTPEHMAGGIKTLNKLAKDGGFKHDFFETNYNRAMISYLDDFAATMGQQAFVRSLVQEGANVGGYAVKRGIITQEALDGVINAPRKYKDGVSNALEQFKTNYGKLSKAYESNLSLTAKTARKSSRLTKEELAAVAAGEADAVTIGGPARIAAKAEELLNINSTKEAYRLALEQSKQSRIALTELTQKFMSVFRDESLALSIVKSQLDDVTDSILNFELKIQNLIDIKNTAELAGDSPQKILMQKLMKELNDESKFVEQQINQAQTFLNADLQLPSLAENFEKIILGIKEPQHGFESDLFDIANYGRTFTYKETELVADTLSGAATGTAGKRSSAALKGLGYDKINYLLSVSSTAERRIASTVPPKTATAKKLENLARIFDSDENINNWITLRNQLNIGDISASSLKGLNNQSVLDILTSAMTSTEANNLGAVRRAVAWIYLREQLLDPNFATRELNNVLHSGEDGIAARMNLVTKHFEMMKIKLKQRKPNVTRFEVDKPNGMPKQASFLNAQANRPIIEAAILRAQKDAAAVDSLVGRPSTIVVNEFSSHLDALRITSTDDFITTEHYVSFKNLFTDLNDIYRDESLEQVIRYFDDKITNPATMQLTPGVPGSFEPGVEQISGLGTYAELDNLLKQIFTEERTLRGTILGHGRISGIDLTQYELLYESEPLITAIGRKIATLKDELDDVDKVSQSATAGLSGQELRELRLMENGGVAHGITRLAHEVGARYLKLENDFKLDQMDELLRPHGQPLTARAQAVVSQLVVEKYVQNIQNHSVLLSRAEAAMRLVRDSVMSQSDDHNLHLIKAINEQLGIPETREALEAVFPSIVIQANLTNAIAPIDSILRNNIEYQSWIDNIVNFRMSRYGMDEAISPRAIPSGGGGPIKPLPRFGTKAEAQANLSMSQARKQEEFLRSPELQKSILKTELLNANSHKRRMTVLEKFLKELQSKPITPVVIRGDASVPQQMIFSEGYGSALSSVQATRAAAENRLAQEAGEDVLFQTAQGRNNALIKTVQDLLAEGQRIEKLVIEDKAIGLAKLEKAKNLSSAALGIPARSQKRALTEAGKAGDMLDYASMGNLYKQATSSNTTSRRAVRELFSNLFGGEQYANPTAIGEAYILTKYRAGAKPSLRVIKESDSFFGRSRVQIDNAVERATRDFPSATTKEVQRVQEARAHVKRLEEKLVRLESELAQQPELMRVLKNTQAEMDKAAKKLADTGADVPQRLISQTYIKAQMESASFPNELPTINRAAYTPRQAGLVTQWSRTTAYLKKLENTTEYLMADREYSLFQFSKVLSGYNVSQIKDEIGQAVWGHSAPNVITLQNNLEQANELLSTATLNENQEMINIAQNQIDDIQNQLSSAGMYNGGMRTFRQEDKDLIRREINKMGFADFEDDVFVINPNGIGNIKNPWNSTNYPQLLERVLDSSKAPLIFFKTEQQADGRIARIAFDVTKPLEPEIGLGGKLVFSTTEERLASLRQLALHYHDTWTIVEPKTIQVSSVNAVGEAITTPKPMVLKVGEQYVPEETWIGISPKIQRAQQQSSAGTKVEKTSGVSDYIVPKKFYQRISEFAVFARKKATNAIMYTDKMGNEIPFNFTLREEQAISANWDDFVYKRISYAGQISEKKYNQERNKLLNLLLEAEGRIATSKKNLGLPTGKRPFGKSGPFVKGRKPGQKQGGTYAIGTVEDQRVSAYGQAVRSAHNLQEAIIELDDAYEILLAKPESIRKVTWLHHYLDQQRWQYSIGAIKGDGKTVKPETALQRFLQPFESSNPKINISVEKSIKNARIETLTNFWEKSNEAKLIRRASKYRGIIQKSQQDFSGDSKLLQDLTSTTKALESAKRDLVNQNPDMLKNEILADVVKAGVSPTYDTSGNISTKTIRKLIDKVGEVKEKEIEDIPFLQPKTFDWIAQAKRDKIVEDLETNRERLFASKEVMEIFKSGEGQINFSDKADALYQLQRALKDSPIKKLTSEQAALLKQYNKLQNALFAKSGKNFKLGLKQIEKIKSSENAITLARAQFDDATLKYSDTGLLETHQKLDAVEAALRELKTIKGMKVTSENIPTIVKEFEIFLSHARPLLDGVGDPAVDKKIRDLTVSYVNSHLQFIKSSAELGEIEQLSLLAKGIGINTSYLDSKGKLRQGAKSEDIAPMFRGALNEQFLLSFDNGMVQLSKDYPNVAVAPEIQKLVQNVHRLAEPEVLRELNKFLGRYTQFFKAYATLSPGFTTRNAISNGFMLFAAGANPKNLIEGIQMSRLFNKAIDSNLTVKEFISSVPLDRQVQVREAIKASSQAGGGNTSELLSSIYSQSRFLHNPATRFARKVNTGLETHSRFMLAYDGVMQGMDANTAAARVRKFLIDYEDISTLDKGMRQIIPFWMWTSRNLPLQVQNIWMNPRAYQIYMNLKRNMTDEDDDNSTVPSWLKEMGAFKLPFGKDLYANPDMGFNRLQSDINMLQDPKRFLSNVNPLLRLPIELTGDRQLFSNKKFSQTPVEVSGGPAGAIQPLLEALGYGETGPDGKKFVNDKAYYALRNLLPPLGQAERMSPSTPTGQEQGNENQQFGYFGLPIRRVLPQMRTGELTRQQMQMQALLRNYQAVNNPEGQ